MWTPGVFTGGKISFTCTFNEKTHKLVKTMFSKLFLFAASAVFVIAYADENGYQYVPNLNYSPSR